MPPPGLPELANVPWRPRVSERSLRRAGRLWTLSTVAHTVPLLVAAVGLVAAKPVTMPGGRSSSSPTRGSFPSSMRSRGAGVVAPAAAGADAAEPGAEHVALGLLGDLVDHEAARAVRADRAGARAGSARACGWWPGRCAARAPGRAARALLLRQGHRPGLPAGDRVAHLLLALRTDEAGFATVANLAFSGACWRLRRRLPEPAREALWRADGSARPLSARAAAALLRAARAGANSGSLYLGPMSRLGPGPIMLTMTRPITSSKSSPGRRSPR